MIRTQFVFCSLVATVVIASLLNSVLGTERQPSETIVNHVPSQDDDATPTTQETQENQDSQSGTQEQTENNDAVQHADQSTSDDDDGDSDVQDPTIPGTELRERMQQNEEQQQQQRTPPRVRPTMELKAKIISTNGSASVVLSVDGVTQFLSLDENSRPDPELLVREAEAIAESNPNTEVRIELVAVSTHEVVLFLYPFGEFVVLY